MPNEFLLQNLEKKFQNRKIIITIEFYMIFWTKFVPKKNTSGQIQKK